MFCFIIILIIMSECVGTLNLKHKPVTCEMPNLSVIYQFQIKPICEIVNLHSASAFSLKMFTFFIPTPNLNLYFCLNLTLKAHIVSEIQWNICEKSDMSQKLRWIQGAPVHQSRVSSPSPKWRHGNPEIGINIQMQADQCVHFVINILVTYNDRIDVTVNLEKISMIHLIA